MRKIESEAQEKWVEAKIFENDAPEEGKSEAKFMATFPYPYMNGKLHLGHGFTASKAEFAVAFERMRGKKTLYPFAFHCTGMPIKASADKLKKEMATYGCPPVVPVEEEGPTTTAKHSKVAAKTGNVKLQWDLLKQLGISDEEIPKFADPAYWMTYFPPHAQRDLTDLGFGIDWRRSFVSTDKNPFYDSFIRWQFNKLRSQNRIKFGKRHTIFSPLDGQPCLDHDRQSGEGVEPKEYTVIKLEIAKFPEGSKFDAVRSSRVFLGAATVRPETMYGQTNCWVGPDLEYGAYKTNVPGELVICTKRAAVNMAYQGLTLADGAVECVATFSGTDLIGLPLHAPLAIIPTVYVLPMFAVSASMGTGIVTSVPSNSPTDFVALKELKNKEPLRRKFNIDDSMVLPFDAVAIIKSPTYGDISAETVVNQLGIKSQNDSAALETAKNLVYKNDFYEGVLSIGPHAGKTVQEAKTIIRDELVAAGSAFIYYEPENLVISRSGDECVVALTDQWYIDYGEPKWRELAERCLQQMNVYSEEVRHQFMATLGWMKQWACSRSFGLGTRLPWDPTYLIESLSDSTIYMAFYSVAHILHGGSLDGSVSPNGIKPEQMTDEVWEFILGEDNPQDMDGAALASRSGINVQILQKMRNEFRFWYPMDLRVSGKDLVPNHLTFSIYNHVAIFPEKFWPQSMRANGHLLLNSQKMSKSTGNFMTIREAIEEFGADATRFALADAGDTVEDANFLRDTANACILRFYNLVEFYQEMKRDGGKLRQDEGKEIFHDLAFAAEINQAIALTEAAYVATNYREALKYAFFELQNARDRYRDATSTNGTIGMNWKLIKRFMEVQALLLSPITPHFSEHVWVTIMGKETSILKERFPIAEPVDEKLLAASGYLQRVAHELRTTLQAELHPKKGPAKPADAYDSADIFVSVAYPKWQEEAISILRSCYDGTKFCADDVIVSSLKPLMKERPNKKLIPFVMELKNRVVAEGPRAFERGLAFDEVAILNENLDYLTRSLGLMRISVKPVGSVADDEGLSADKEILRRREASLPGEPSAHFYHRD
jgi:leucyl-tRNA synthetase